MARLRYAHHIQDYVISQGKRREKYLCEYFHRVCLFLVYHVYIRGTPSLRKNFMIEKTVCIAALFLLALPGASQAQTPIVVTVNGDAVAFAGQPPVSQNGRLLVPLRGVLEKIGAMVRYSGPTKTIAATKGGINIQLTLGETSANVSGRTVTLDVPAQAVAGTTLVPLRFVAESLGADVKYDGTARVVAIRTDGKPNVIAQPKPVVDAKSPAAKINTDTFTGIFEDFAENTQQSDALITLKMTDGRTVAFRKNADLTYQGQKIGFDDLRSGDKIVATLNRNSRGIGATVSDSEE